MGPGQPAGAHPKLRPVETLTAGIYLTGCAQGPKDIPETVAQASGAAARAITILSKPELEMDPLIASVDKEICTGCGVCVDSCPTEVLGLADEKVKIVDSELCSDCLICMQVCPYGVFEVITEE